MKKLFLAAFAILALNACTNPKDEEKKALNEIIKIHDNVMGNDEHLMQNKMKLDTLSPPDKFADKYTPQQKAMMRALSLKLSGADATMEGWMNKFDPAQKGKSHEEIMAYLTDQKKQVLYVDSMVTVAVQESNDFLKHLKK
jgi:hypothetical protein